MTPLARTVVRAALVVALALTAGLALGRIAALDRGPDRLRMLAAEESWRVPALQREAHAERFAARLGLIDGDGRPMPELLDRDAWRAIDGEIAHARAEGDLRAAVRGLAPLTIAAAVALLLVALVTLGGGMRAVPRPLPGRWPLALGAAAAAMAVLGVFWQLHLPTALRAAY